MESNSNIISTKIKIIIIIIIRYVVYNIVSEINA